MFFEHPERVNLQNSHEIVHIDAWITNGAVINVNSELWVEGSCGVGEQQEQSMRNCQEWHKKETLLYDVFISSVDACKA